MNYCSYFKKISLRKIINYFKLLISYYISIIIKSPVCWGMPVTIAIEPTNLCNLACMECPIGTNGLNRVRGNMKLTLFIKIVKQLSNKLISIILYFQGEPYLNQDLFEMIQIAKHSNIYSFCSTNGHFLDEENARKTVASGLDELIISLDGVSQKVYEEYRVKGQLDKVLRGTKTIIGYRKKMKMRTPFIKFQFLVLRTNEHQIEDAKLLTNKVGVDKIIFKTAQIYNFVHGSPLIPVNQRYSRYKKQTDGSYKIKSKLKNSCWRMWSNPVITVDGTVIPCCFDKDAKYAMGNLNKHSFKEIWEGEKYQNFRRKILKSRKSIDICKNCTEGLSIFK